LCALVAITALALAAAARADRPAVKKGENPNKKATDVKDRTALEQQILARRFANFKAALLRVQQRLEKGTDDDKKQAVALKKALERIDANDLPTQFNRLVDFLKHKALTNPNNVEEALEQSKKLAEEIRALLAILRDDNRLGKLRGQNRRYAELLSELDKII